MTLTMNYHFFPELVCKTKKKRPFYIDHMLKAPRGKVRALFSNSLSTTSLICPYNWPAYLLGFLFYLLRQKSWFATSVCNAVCDMTSEIYILENR